MTCPRRHIYFALGWLFFALGLIGAVLPVMPTTVFMIMALWAWARSSQKLHDRLYHHPVFGPALQRWDAHRVIPPAAKAMAVGGMALGLSIMVFVAKAPLWADLAAAAVIAYGLWYVLSKPSHPPPVGAEKA